MSSLYFNVYVEPKDSLGCENIKKFIGFVNGKDYDSFKKLDERGCVFSPESYLDFDIKSKIEGGVFNLEFDTATSFDEESIFKFLKNIGAGRIEAELYDSQVGEYGYFLNSEVHDDYYSIQWKWLPEPYDIDIMGMNIAIVGEITDSCLAAIEFAEEEFGAIRVEHINSNTSLVVTCGDVQKQDLKMAEKYGVRVISEDHFTDISG